MRVVVAGPVNSLGYGIVVSNVIHALSEVGATVYYRPWPPGPGSFSRDDLRMFRGDVCASITTAYDRWNKDRPDSLPHLQIYHEWLLGGPWSGPTIGVPFFETTPIRMDAIVPLQACSRVIATSAWAKDVMGASEIKSDYVRFVGFDPVIFHPRNRPERAADKFVYLHVGKFEIRKGIDVVIQAFGRIAREHSDAELWLMIDNPFYPKWYGEFIKRLVGAKLTMNKPRVFVLRRRPSHVDMDRLYKQVDVVVQPSRGEGFGLPSLEAAACGAVVAATACTGHAEFADLLSITIPHGRLVPALDGVFFDGTRRWYDVSVDDVYKAMKEAREHVPLRDIDTKNYTWEAGAIRLLEYLERSYGR